MNIRRFTSIRAAMRQIMPPIAVTALKTVISTLHPSQSEASEQTEAEQLHRLSLLPKYTGLRIRLLGRELIVTDAQSFYGIYHAYFLKQVYQFRADSASPFIIDCGANVGLGVRYWKQLYPGARVIAFEPDPVAFSALAYNCNDLTSVSLQGRAVWNRDGEVEFASIGGDGGHIRNLSTQPAGTQIRVPCIRLAQFLNEPVDLLKMDIEGAEIDTLNDCADQLWHVKRIFVEYHSFVERPQRLAELVSLLENAGFRLHAQIDESAPQPFLNRPVFNGKDFRLNIFGVRPESETMSALVGKTG